MGIVQPEHDWVEITDVGSPSGQRPGAMGRINGNGPEVVGEDGATYPLDAQKPVDQSTIGNIVQALWTRFSRF